MLKYYLDKTGKVIKSILFPSSEFVDTEPREGSLNPITSGAVANVMPQDASKDNPLMTAADTERMILENTTPSANTLRFSFSKLDYSPVVAGVGSSGTWKKVSKYAENNVWDWTKSGTTFANAFENAFQDSDNLVSVIAAGNTSTINTTRSMFSGCTSLTSVPLFDTSAVTTMFDMFYGCISLTSVPLFDTSAVSTMYRMFSGCTSLTSVPLFDTSAVSTMYRMFFGCTSLTSVPLFDTSAVSNMEEMFSGCTSLTSVPLFDTSAVTNMFGTLRGCTSLTSVPLFNTSKVTNMNNAFYGCTKVEEGSLALYQQASTQETPPANHTGTFTNCGRDTPQGRAALAQIPASWGGTGPEPTP